MYFMKQYPTEREMKVMCRDRKIASGVLRRMKRHAQYLASRMDPLLADQWDSRKQHPRPSEVVEVFGEGVMGCVDATPIYIQRPDDHNFRLATWQGKYKRFVLKLQMCCTFQGIPLFLRFLIKCLINT